MVYIFIFIYLENVSKTFYKSQAKFWFYVCNCPVKNYMKNQKWKGNHIPSAKTKETDYYQNSENLEKTIVHI